MTGLEAMDKISELKTEVEQLTSLWEDVRHTYGSDHKATIVLAKTLAEVRAELFTISSKMAAMEI